MNEFKSKLLEALLDNNFKKIISVIYDKLHCHFNITDEYYRLIIQIPKEKINDLIWDTYLLNDSLPPEIIKLLNEGQLIEKGYTSEKPYVISSPTIGAYPRVTIHIQYDRKIYGYLTVYFIDREIEEIDLEVIDCASNVLAHYFSRNTNPFSSIKSVYELMMNQLFLGSIHTEKELQNWQSILPEPICENCQIICAQNEGAANIVLLQKICHELKYTYHFEKCSVFKDRLYLLVEKPMNKSMLMFQNQLISLLTKYDLKIGISCEFNQLLESRIYRKQAEIASSLCRLGKYNYFEDCSLEAIGQMIREKKVYVHSAFNILKEYDEVNNTDYYETLIAYLIHFGRQNEMEIELKVHRNTVRNRIAFIEKMTHLSLDDAYTFSYLYMSYILLNNCA